MAVIKEPKNVDFIIKSKPWTNKELSEFSELIKKQKQKNARRKLKVKATKIK
jgi:hypothetical protein